jgi:single-strand DNA-binding protein
MNKIVLTGNCGHNATIRTTDKGGMVTFSLAVGDRRKNDKGEWEQIRTDWFDCVIYTNTADGANKLGASITSGTRMLITGEMQSRQYEKDGVKRTAWNVRVNELEFIGNKRDEQVQAPAPEQPKEAKPAKQSDLPF